MSISDFEKMESIDTTNLEFIIAIDPGTKKVAYALLDLNQNVHHIASSRELSYFDKTILEMTSQKKIAKIVIGNGTGSKAITERIKKLLPNIEIITIDETGTTEVARKRFWSSMKPFSRWYKTLFYILGWYHFELDTAVAIALGRKYLDSMKTT